MTLLNRISNWKGCATQYWEGVAICREHGNLSDQKLRMLAKGMTSCKQEEIIVLSLGALRKRELDAIAKLKPHQDDEDETQPDSCNS